MTCINIILHIVCSDTTRLIDGRPLSTEYLNLNTATTFSRATKVASLGVSTNACQYVLTRCSALDRVYRSMSNVYI